MTFDEFDLEAETLDTLREQGLTTPTPIQEQAIPVALEGKDVVGIAQTGTGKTLGFTLPSLTRLKRSGAKRNSMLVLTPTRELCAQVHDVVKSFGRPLRVSSTTVYGGVNMNRQVEALEQGRQVIVATPGRLLDHMRRKNVRFDNLQVLVLDEADRMLDMGFLPDITDIVEQLPKDRQTMMFSATFPPPIARLAEKMMRDPQRIEVGGISKPVDAVRQVLIPVEQPQKTNLLLEILEEEEPGSTLVFLRTKVATEGLGNALQRKGYKIGMLHGDRSQGQRQQALKGFREGKYDILVATDVAARGLDIADVTHVINFDIPENPDDYVHRIGRTARAKREGDAITFVTPADWQSLGAIEKALGYNIDRVEKEDAPRVISVFKKDKGKSKRKSTTRRVAKRGVRRR